jgi:hypothetical protein
VQLFDEQSLRPSWASCAEVWKGVEMGHAVEEEQHAAELH